MNIQTQRFIDRWAGQLLCGGVSAWVRLTGLFGTPARMPAAPKNILVILLSEMGSIVLAGPMFAELRRKYPGAAIHILQLKKNQEVSKLLSLTEADHMHTLDDSSGGALISDILKVSLKFRSIGLDAVIDCELFSRVSALLSFSTGAPVRVGFTPTPRKACTAAASSTTAFRTTPTSTSANSFCRWWMHWMHRTACRATALPRSATHRSIPNFPSSSPIPSWKPTAASWRATTL